MQKFLRSRENRPRIFVRWPLTILRVERIGHNSFALQKVATPPRTRLLAGLHFASCAPAFDSLYPRRSGVGRTNVLQWRKAANFSERWKTVGFQVVRVERIELSSSHWKCDILPLNHTRIHSKDTITKSNKSSKN